MKIENICCYSYLFVLGVMLGMHTLKIMDLFILVPVAIFVINILIGNTRNANNV